MIDAKGLNDVPGFAGRDIASLREHFDGTAMKNAKILFEKIKALNIYI